MNLNQVMTSLVQRSGMFIHTATNTLLTRYHNHWTVYDLSSNGKIVEKQKTSTTSHEQLPQEFRRMYHFSSRPEGVSMFIHDEKYFTVPHANWEMVPMYIWQYQRDSLPVLNEALRVTHGDQRRLVTTRFNTMYTHAMLCTIQEIVQAALGSDYLHINLSSLDHNERLMTILLLADSPLIAEAHFEIEDGYVLSLAHPYSVYLKDIGVENPRGLNHFHPYSIDMDGSRRHGIAGVGMFWNKNDWIQECLDRLDAPYVYENPIQKEVFLHA